MGTSAVLRRRKGPFYSQPEQDVFLFSLARWKPAWELKAQAEASRQGTVASALQYWRQLVALAVSNRFRR
jgi:hypothetical protein